MARTREFDPEKALQVAVDVFWEKGYADGSVDEVVRRSGVAKYGIYGTFGGKNELFKKALTRYAEYRKEGLQRALSHEGVALPELKKFFRSAVKMMTDEKNRQGCLLCNTGVEVGAADPEIQKIVQTFNAFLALTIQQCLKRAVAKGQIDRLKASKKIATYLANEFRTALIMSRCGDSRQSIQQHFDVALSVLD